MNDSLGEEVITQCRVEIIFGLISSENLNLDGNLDLNHSVKIFKEKRCFSLILRNTQEKRLWSSTNNRNQQDPMMIFLTCEGS